MLFPLAAGAQTGDGDALVKGRKLMAQKKFDEACPILQAASLGSTLVPLWLALGECQEKLGLPVLGWRAFKQALDLAEEEGKNPTTRAAGNLHAKDARKRLGEAEKKIGLISVVVPEEVSRDTLKLTVDGDDMSQVLWPNNIPVDPSPMSRRVVLTVPGKKVWSKDVTILAGGEKQELWVQLENAPAPEPTAKAETPKPLPPPPPPPPLWGRKQWFWTSVGVGGAGVLCWLIAAISAGVAHSTWTDSEAECQGRLCTPKGVALRSDAMGSGDVATGFFVVGTLAMLAGGGLYYLNHLGWIDIPAPAKERPRASVTVAPALSGSSGGLVMQGVW